MRVRAGARNVRRIGSAALSEGWRCLLYSRLALAFPFVAAVRTRPSGALFCTAVGGLDARASVLVPIAAAALRGAIAHLVGVAIGGLCRVQPLPCVRDPARSSDPKALIVSMMVLTMLLDRDSRVPYVCGRWPRPRLRPRPASTGVSSRLVSKEGRTRARRPNQRPSGSHSR